MKPRVLVIISFSFSIRYICRTGLLEQLRQICIPIVGITWDQRDLIEELTAEGYEVHLLPQSERSVIYNNIRRKIDLWFFNYRLKTPSRKIQEQWLSTFGNHKFSLLSLTRSVYNLLKFLLPQTIYKLMEQHEQLLISDTAYIKIEGFVDKLNIKAVFTVTPFHAQEDILLQVCKRKGMKMMTSILSFDNITKRGWLPLEFDLYMVWNKYNENEVKRAYQPSMTSSKVAVVGAAQFDFYKRTEFIVSKEDWLRNVGLPNNNKKIILYAGGPKALFPNEFLYLKQIDDAIEDGSIKDSPLILFRCHPIDNINRWKTMLKECKHIYFDKSWTGINNLFQANITKEDIKKLCSTLYYTDVHINLCSTMTVDGSVYNKPQIAPAYDQRGYKESKLLQKMYYQEHFLPIIRVNGVSLAKSKTELIEFINQGLFNDLSLVENCQNVINEIITFNDGQSTNRVVELIRLELSKNENTQSSN
jgi:hypothetical protein